MQIQVCQGCGWDTDVLASVCPDCGDKHFRKIFAPSKADIDRETEVIQKRWSKRVKYVRSVVKTEPVEVKRGTLVFSY